MEAIDATGPDGRPQMVHIKGFHPLDDHYGLGSLSAAAEAIAVHNAATRWNRALLDNAARPSGALVYDPGDGSTLSPEQFARLKAELEGAYQGPGNSGRPMLLEGGLSWQSMALTPADMDFAGLKEAAARDIALAFGVPPMLLGLPGDNSYANYREANKALWRLSILPLAQTICEAISQGLADWFPDASLRIRPRSYPGAVRGPRTAVVQRDRRRFPDPRGKARNAGAETRGGRMNTGDLLAGLSVEARREGIDGHHAARDHRGSKRRRRCPGAGAARPRRWRGAGRRQGAAAIARRLARGQARRVEGGARLAGSRACSRCC